MHAIRIDRNKPLCDEPNCGHNRYHPDIAPAAEIGEGEEIALETRDALDGQITPGHHRRRLRRARRRQGASADRSGVRQGRAAGRHARDRVHRHHPAAHRVQRDHAGPRLPARRDDRAVPGALAAQGQLGDIGAASRRAHSRRAVHGRVRRRTHRGTARRMDRARAAGDRPRRLRAAARCRRRGARRALRSHRPAHPAAARERRQFRREAADQGRQTVSAGVQGGRAVLHRRRALRAGRRRGLRHRGRDGRHRRGALQAAQGTGDPAQIHRAGVLARRPTSPIRASPRPSVSWASWACRSTPPARSRRRT